MPFNPESFKNVLQQGRGAQLSLRALEQSAKNSSLAPGLRPEFDFRSLKEQPIEKLALSPLLSSTGYRDKTLNPSARKSMRSSALQIMRLKRRIEARGGTVPKERGDNSFPSFMELLDNLIRPQSAVFNTVIGLRQGMPPAEVMKNFAQGFTFEERAYFLDVMKEFGADPDHTANKVLGFAGDLVLDPVNLVPGYIFYAPLKLAGKTAMRARVIREILHSAGNTKLVSTMKRAFVSTSGNKLLDDLKHSGAGYAHTIESEILEKTAVFDSKWGGKLGENFDNLAWLAENPELIKNIRVRQGGKIMAGGNHAALQSQVQDAVADYTKLKNQIKDLGEIHNINVPDITDELMHSLVTVSRQKHREAVRLSRAGRKHISKKTNRIKDDLRAIDQKIPDQIGREFLHDIKEQIPLRRAGPSETPSPGYAVPRGTSPGYIVDTDRLSAQGVTLIMSKTKPIIDKIKLQLRERARIPKFITEGDAVKPRPRSAAQQFALAGHMVERGKKGLLTYTEISPKKAVKAIQEGLEDFASGKISEHQLEEIVNMFVGPGALRRITGLSEAASLIKSRRDALLRITKLRGEQVDDVTDIVDTLVQGTFSMEEALEIYGKFGVRTGMNAFIRSVGSRVNKVNGWLGETTLQEMPTAVRRVMEDFIAGDITKAEALEFIGGKTGAKTLRKALNTIRSRMTAYDQLENVTRPRMQERIGSALFRRFGARIMEIEDLMSTVDPWVGHMMSGRGIRALVNRPELVGKLADENTARLMYRRFAENGMRPLEMRDVEEIVSKGMDAMTPGGTRMFSPKGFMDIVKNNPQEAAKLMNVSPTVVLETAAMRTAKAIGEASYLDETARLWGVRVFSQVAPRTLQEWDDVLVELSPGMTKRVKNFKDARAAEKEMLQLQIQDKVRLAEKPTDAASIGSRIAQREKRLEKLRTEIRHRENLLQVDTPSLREAGEQLGRVSDQDIQTFGGKVPDGHVPAKHPRLKGWHFPAEIAEEVERATTNAFSEETAGAVKKVFDSMQDYWKIWTLGVFPAYHTRNGIGNVFNMHLAGMFRAGNTPQSFSNMVVAGNLQRWGSSGNTEALRGITRVIHNGAELDGNQLLALMKKKGIINHGFFAKEMDPRRVGDMGSKFQKSILGTRGPVTKAGRAVGTAMENNARAALFLHYLDNGKTIEDATHLTKKFLFDYNDITKFEKEWMRTLFPFYIWTRKNIPLQLEQLIKQPHIFSRIPKTMHAASQIAKFDEDETPPNKAIPKWIQESSAFPVKRTKDGRLQFFVLRNWLPAADIDEFLGAERIGRTVFSMTSPLITQPIETILKKNMYFDSDLVGPQEFVGLRMDKRLVNNLRMSRLLSTLDAMDPMEMIGLEQFSLRKQRGSVSKLSRLSAFLTGLKPPVASPEREVLSRTVERRDQLRSEFGRIRGVERRRRLGL